MKEFKGKAIYNPSGKAGEYSYWACNFYTGCSNSCDYCYCRKGVMSSVWTNKAQLKKCFKNEDNALDIFEKELIQNVEELRKHGLFFSFTTDPMLPETNILTLKALYKCLKWYVPVKILTKCTDWLDNVKWKQFLSLDAVWSVAFGFTLTGHDELEPGAASNMQRIEAMKKLYDMGFKTFASIEPIVDIESSMNMISESYQYCDLFKIGLMSGKKYDFSALRQFIEDCSSIEKPIYYKESLRLQSGVGEPILPLNSVKRDYNIFKA